MKMNSFDVWTLKSLWLTTVCVFQRKLAHQLAHRQHRHVSQVMHMRTHSVFDLSTERKMLHFMLSQITIRFIETLEYIQVNSIYIYIYIKAKSQCSHHWGRPIYLMQTKISKHASWTSVPRVSVCCRMKR